jgi:hypothetical protein
VDTGLVMFVLVLGCGVVAAVCALAAAYVYLAGAGDDVHGDRVDRDRRARQWLIGTVVFGVGAIVLRFVWALM